MAITLPPAITPENVPVAEIRGQDQQHPIIARGRIRVHVLGAHDLAPGRLETAVAAGASLSDAVYAIQRALYEAGYPATRIRYAFADPDLYVMVTQPRLAALDMPEPYAGHFRRALGAQVFDETALEPSRVLASLHADRAGQQGPLTLRAQGEDVVLGFKPEPVQGSRLRLRAGVGNPGTRFVGRYFGDYAGQYSTRKGEDLALTGRHALSGLNKSEGGGDYAEHSLVYSRVFTRGIAGLTARNLDYQVEQDVAGFPESIAIDGELQQAELSWLTIPAAGFRHRWSLGAKLDYTHKAVRAEAFDTLLQKQEYGSAELATDYTVALGPVDAPLQIAGAIAVRHGLRGNRDDQAPTLANLGYWLVRPSLQLSKRIDARFNASLVVQTQFSDDRVPEQQQWLSGSAGNLEAYLPGVIVGDSGGLARVQLGFPGWEVGQWKLVPSTFAEYARARLEVPDPNRQQANTAAADLGAALALTWRKTLDATLAYSEPVMDRGLRDAALDDAEAGLLFRVTLTY